MKTRPPDDDADIPDDDLVAYLDGELDSNKTRDVESKLAHDPKSREKMQSYRKTWDLLDNLPKVEPSRSFTERTMGKIEPIPATAVSSTGPALSVAGPSATFPAFPPARRSVAGRLVIAAAILAGLGGGYLGKAWWTARHMPAPPNHDAEILAEMGLLRNIDLYKYVDDMELLSELAKPEFFGDEK